MSFCKYAVYLKIIKTVRRETICSMSIKSPPVYKSIFTTYKSRELMYKKVCNTEFAVLKSGFNGDRNNILYEITQS